LSLPTPYWRSKDGRPTTEAAFTPKPVRVTFGSPTLTADFELPPAAAMRLGQIVLDTLLEYHRTNDKVEERRAPSTFAPTPGSDSEKGKL